MRKILIIMAALAVSSAFAAEVNIGRALLGSGTPGQVGPQNAIVVDNARVENNILHAPQYLPNNPTAATIWPRAVEVPCTRGKNGNLNCASYNWSPAMGRAEYLFVIPRVVEPAQVTKSVAAPVVIQKLVPGPERIREVFIEVAPKKIGQ